MKQCHQCGEIWDGSPGTQPGRNETCVKCGADLHSCLNCRLFDQRSFGCTSRTTEAIKDRERRNYCEEFDFGGKPGSGGSSPKSDMESKWGNLFNG